MALEQVAGDPEDVVGGACRSTPGRRTSNSQYSSKVVTATIRDATHTLDGILDNQTVLPIAEHTTDTHGYTEMIFGAYDLLGLRFAPRIRDLDRQRLYRHGPPPAVETAELLEHKIPSLFGRPAVCLLRVQADQPAFSEEGSRDQQRSDCVSPPPPEGRVG